MRSDAARRRSFLLFFVVLLLTLAVRVPTGAADDAEEIDERVDDALQRFRTQVFTETALADFRKSDKWSAGAESGVTVVHKGFGGSVETLKNQTPWQALPSEGRGSWPGGR